MKNNDGRFLCLKRKIGGNREKTGFEYTFGMTREEQMNITSPSPSIRRIMSEIEFALKLDGELKGEYSDCIGGALTLLEKAMERDGVLSNSVCLEAEELLMPMADRAKEYSVILAGHAHIDMNWQWGYDETVSATLSTFDTMLDLMDEYPDFTFSQSQTSVYEIVEKYAPDMKARILDRIREGRWEITATQWVETDKNMPGTESLLNTVKYTRDYLESNWEIDPESLYIDFVPDTFGHNINVPEIDRFTNVKYCYHCRGLNGDYVLYKYRSPSGAELLMYREPYWYNSAITPHIGIGLIDVCRRMGGLKTGLIVYGVGNHGGGVTRRDVERAYEMMDWPVFPAVRFGTLREFFALADDPDIRSRIPTVDKELNFLFEGCYTTQSRIKRANKYVEQSLNEAEAMSALCNVNFGRLYNEKGFEKAWQNTLFTHFHDILTGSCVQNSREHAMGLYQEAKAYADTELKYSLSEISKNIDVSFVKRDNEEDIIANSQSEGAGVGYGPYSFRGVPNPERGVGKTRVFNIFNTTSAERDDLCEITVWDWVGDMRRVSVEDENGNDVQFALVDGGLQHYWDHKFFRVLVKISVPAFGYRTVVLKEKEQQVYPFYYGNTCNVSVTENARVLENEYLRAEFDMQTMALVSLYNKENGIELIDKGRHCGVSVIDTQVNGMSAWCIGEYLLENPLTDIRFCNPFGFGELRKGYRFETHYKTSVITVEVTLDKGAKHLCWNINVHWHERVERTMPLLVLRMPLSFKAEKALCDIPAGYAERQVQNRDIPALTFTTATGEGKALFASADSKYGYRLYDNCLTVTLINTAHSPDPYPERGIHDIKIHTGIPEETPLMQSIASDRLMRSLRYVPTNPHRGKLPPYGTLARLNSESSRLLTVTKDKNHTVVRVVEYQGKKDSVTIDLGHSVKKAYLADISGCRTGDCAVSGTKVTFTVLPYSIESVYIEF